jgi:hypothetical protein
VRNAVSTATCLPHIAVVDASARSIGSAGACEVASLVMAALWNRIPVWADWVVAVIAAIVVLNVNVTTAGDPLSGMGLSAGATSAGITEGARATFYGALVVGGVLLTATGLIISTSDRRRRTAGGLLTRTFAGVALAGVLGLLLDYRDGPVRTVQLFVYLMLALSIVRLARVAALATDDLNPEPDQSVAPRSSDARR